MSATTKSIIKPVENLLTSDNVQALLTKAQSSSATIMLRTYQQQQVVYSTTTWCDCSEEWVDEINSKKNPVSTSLFLALAHFNHGVESVFSLNQEIAIQILQGIQQLFGMLKSRSDYFWDWSVSTGPCVVSGKISIPQLQGVYEQVLLWLDMEGGPHAYSYQVKDIEILKSFYLKQIYLSKNLEELERVGRKILSYPGCQQQGIRGIFFTSTTANFVRSTIQDRKKILEESKCQQELAFTNDLGL